MHSGSSVSAGQLSWVWVINVAAASQTRAFKYDEKLLWKEKKKWKEVENLFSASLVDRMELKMSLLIAGGVDLTASKDPFQSKPSCSSVIP